MPKFLNSEAIFIARRSLVTISQRLFGWRPSWSQYGEDLILFALLAQRKGSYVDIGSGRPKLHSNTYFFYRLGWSGICLDANQRNSRLHRIFRPRDVVINAACGQIDGQFATAYYFSPWQLSTLDESTALSQIAAGAKLLRQEPLEIVSLKSLHLKSSPEDGDFLSLDVEGLDLEVLQGNDWEEYSPSVIAVENNITTSDKDAIERYLSGKGYSLISQCGPTGIFMHANAGLAWVI